MATSADTEQQMDQLAREDGAAKAALRLHLIAYFGTIGLLCLLNIFMFPGYYWVLWLALGWGICVVGHAIAVLAFSSEFQDEVEPTDEAI
jgi:hypothetical protein